MRSAVRVRLLIDMWKGCCLLPAGVGWGGRGGGGGGWSQLSCDLGCRAGGARCGVCAGGTCHSSAPVVGAALLLLQAETLKGETAPRDWWRRWIHGFVLSRVTLSRARLRLAQRYLQVYADLSILYR